MLEFLLLMNRGIPLLSDNNSTGGKHRHLPNKPRFTPVFLPKRTQILVTCSPPHVVHDSEECNPTAGTRSGLSQSHVTPPPPPCAVLVGHTKLAQTERREDLHSLLGGVLSPSLTRWLRIKKPIAPIAAGGHLAIMRSSRIRLQSS